MENSIQAGEPALRLQAHHDYSYVPRTSDNALGADVTVAFAKDFGTAGEKLTKRQAGFRYIGIPFGGDVATAAEALSEFLIARGGTTLNVAGNGIYTMAEHGVNQERCNQWVFDVLARVAAKVKLALIRSGGQTGIDQAGLVAALALGIPALGHYPKNFRRRNAQGKEVTATAAAIRAELETQAAVLKQGGGWSFHVDGTLPTALDGQVFVFGSNLAGRHGKGAAAVAKEHFGAKPGVGPGRQGQSYGIPTKDGRPLPGNPRPSFNDPEQTLPLSAIKPFIAGFIEYAKAHPDERFFVTRVGCGLAGYEDKEVAPLFAAAPANCSFPEDWKPWLGGAMATRALAPAINIWSGAHGLGGALTNMSERAKEKGCIKNSYPVKVNGVTYPDSEAAYQALKIQGEEEYNDGLMIDLIALKFLQNTILFERVTKNGGVAWLEKCSHFTQAKTERAQSWEGQGNGSRFIRNLIHGYQKAESGVGPTTRVVHVKEAPYDVYIGRQMGSDFPHSEWHNPFKVDSSRSREAAVEEFYEYAKGNQELMAKVRTLKGRTLGCWCKCRDNVHLLCHGEVLAALADGREWVAPQAAQGSLF
ncbi:DUF4326 domain-containing protein [Burkholderia ubonensis]|uniref:A1S_2505 family phage non-structural protein n=1 Tax=Burkholderia ubonensis TaxID=101571 RepID=UPI0007C7BA1A|nr:DUF4326 domain-containing protein [Burkholderia ubonensis]